MGIRVFIQKFRKAWKLANQEAPPVPTQSPGINQDQLSILTDVYGQLREHLINSQKELEATNKGLEEKIKLRTKELEELSIRDGLTGLFNRRHYDERIEEELSRAKRHQLQVSIVYLDLDNFKNYNDTNGHPSGDILLEQFGDALKSIIRASDVPCRIGGEEFCVILPHTDLSNALVVAEKIRHHTESTNYAHGEKQPLGRVTCSVGVSEYPSVAQNSKELLATADKALYHSKKNGRNQVTSALETTAAQAS
jgi:diguanylate cyclase (GGDEF)-like protein